MEGLEQVGLRDAGREGTQLDTAHGDHVGVEQAGVEVLDDVATKGGHGRGYGYGEDHVCQLSNLRGEHEQGVWV